MDFSEIQMYMKMWEKSIDFIEYNESFLQKNRLFLYTKKYDSIKPESFLEHNPNSRLVESHKSV